MRTGPDLRVLLCALGAECAKKWPELITPDDVDRVRNADDVLLVLARVLAVIAVRAGLPRDVIAAATETASKPVPVRAVLGPRADVKDVPDAYTLMWRVDDALSDIRRRDRFPGWFVNSYWPALLRRISSGGAPSVTDQSILMMQLELVNCKRG